jgi:hypothetical protein
VRQPHRDVGTEFVAVDAVITRGTLRWAALVLSLGVALGAYAAQLAWAGRALAAAVLGYFAASVLAVGALYFRAAGGRNPGPYLKGERAPWLQVVFLPWRGVAWLVTLAARAARPATPVSEFAEGLYVGVRLFYVESGRLERLGVRCVVDLCAELPTNLRHARAPYERLGVPVLDRCSPAPDELARVVDWVAARRAAGHAVYIHCAFGRGRSALVAAAVLLRLGLAEHPDAAVAQLRRARRVVHVAGAQYAALVGYARRLGGTAPVTTAAP